MITRVRIEASAKTRDGVMDELIGAAFLVRDTYGGEWEDDRESWTDRIHTTSDGYWGRITIKHADAPSAKKKMEDN